MLTTLHLPKKHALRVNSRLKNRRTVGMVLIDIQLQSLIQDFLLRGGGGGNRIFEEILDIFGQQNRRIQL